MIASRPTVRPRLLILGTGSIAAKHAAEFTALADCEIVAAADTVPDRAASYAAKFGIGHSFGDLDAALAWGGFDAAVNATPDPVHFPTTMKLLAAGKHVLCEKPLAVNHTDAFVMADAAERAGVMNMVNLTYRNSRALQAARAMIAGGEIGAVRHVEASYLQSWLTAAHWGDWRTDERWLWRLSSAHGSGGVLGDVGIHIVDFTTYGVGHDMVEVSARLKVFDKAPGGRIGPYLMDVNDSVTMNVGFANGALGVVHMSRLATGHANDLNLTIHGASGAVRIWSDSGDSTLDVCVGSDIQTQTWRRVTCAAVPGNAARFVAALRSGVNGEPDFRRAAEMQRILDLCVESDASGRRLGVSSSEVGSRGITRPCESRDRTKT